MRRATLTYLIGACITLLLLPLLLLQGAWVRRSVPRLPEASGPRRGHVAGDGETLRILMLGESTAAGVGVESCEQSIVARLAAALSDKLNRSCHWHLLARSGLTAEGIREELLSEMDQQAYDLIVICLGGNDCFSLHSPWRWKRDCAALVAALRKQGQKGPILFSDVPPVGQFPAFPAPLRWILGALCQSYRQPLHEVAATHAGVSFQDDPFVIDCNEDISLYFSDGVHPSGYTYQLWAGGLAETAEDILT